MRSIALSLAAVFMLGCLTLASEARGESWKNTSVLTKGGWVFEGVAVEVSRDSTALQVTHPSGGQRLIPIAEVRVIRSSDGSDITQIVLSGLRATAGSPVPASPAPEGSPEAGDPSNPDRTLGAPAKETGEEAASPASRKKQARPLYGGRFRFGLGGAVGYGTPSGDWFEGFSGGSSLGLHARAVFAEKLYLGFLYTRQNLGVDSEYQDIEGLQVDWSVHLNEIYLVAGMISAPRKLTSPLAYLEAGFGAAAHKVSADVSYGGDSASLGEVMDKSYTSLLVGAGMIIPLSASLGIDVRGDLRLTGDQSVGQVLGLWVGVTTMLGR